MKPLHTALYFALLLYTTLLAANPFKDYTFHAGPTINFARFSFENLPKLQGCLAGVHADVIHKHESNISTRVKFDARWNAGHISGESSLKGHISDYRPELDLGYRIAINKTVSFLPFTGVGFYLLAAKLTNDDITRQFYNIYVPVGAQVIWKIKGSNFDIGIAGEYRINTWSRAKLKIPNIGSTNKIKIRHSEGVLIEMPMTWHFHTDYGVKIHSKIVPYFDWNRFGRSQSVSINNTAFNALSVKQWYLGLHADVGIHF